MSECVETERELLVLANNIASGMSLHKSAVMWTVDCVFITGVHARWWLGENMILDKTLYNLVKQEVVAAPLTAKCSSSLQPLSRPS